mmetsp:Transcript_21653/g.62135  ORF Transcript_21653/g.62135 Transcript_21653/m.62135 type:complete len:208 (+) Transcript_21653:996-1619(+)
MLEPLPPQPSRRRPLLHLAVGPLLLQDGRDLVLGLLRRPVPALLRLASPALGLPLPLLLLLLGVVFLLRQAQVGDLLQQPLAILPPHARRNPGLDLLGPGLALVPRRLALVGGGNFRPGRLGVGVPAIDGQLRCIGNGGVVFVPFWNGRSSVSSVGRGVAVDDFCRHHGRTTVAIHDRTFCRRSRLLHRCSQIRLKTRLSSWKHAAM